MIWLNESEHAELLDHPAIKATDEANVLAAERAKDRGTVEAIAASQRAAEAAYWLAQDLAHELAHRNGRPHAST